MAASQRQKTVTKNIQFKLSYCGIHPDRHKNRRSTKAQMERQTRMKMEQAWNGLYPAAAVEAYGRMAFSPI